MREVEKFYKEWKKTPSYNKTKMKKLITIILILFALSVNGQEYGNYQFDTAYKEQPDTTKVKMLIYSECHNGAICVSGYRTYHIKVLGFDINLAESFYDHKWQPIDKTKIFSWIKYNWEKRKRK